MAMPKDTTPAESYGAEIICTRRGARGNWTPTTARVQLAPTRGRVHMRLRGGNTIQLTAEQARALGRQLLAYAGSASRQAL